MTISWNWRISSRIYMMEWSAGREQLVTTDLKRHDKFKFFKSRKFAKLSISQLKPKLKNCMRWRQALKFVIVQKLGFRFKILLVYFFPIIQLYKSHANLLFIFKRVSLYPLLFGGCHQPYKCTCNRCKASHMQDLSALQ